MIDTQALNQAFDQSGLKKSAVADKMGCTVQTLTSKLNGESEFTVSQAQDLSDILGLAPSLRQRIFFPRM